MQARAAGALKTRNQILGAMLELYRERWYDEITLKDVADTAGVALQTVVNHFSTKEGLLTALLEDPRLLQEFAGKRLGGQPRDTREAIELLVADYERAGDAMIRLLALESRTPSLAPHLDMGRVGQRLWLASVFDGRLSHLPPRRREHRLDLLACATDVYTWQILRRGQGHSRAETVAAMLDLVEAIVAAPPTNSDRGPA